MVWSHLVWGALCWHQTWRGFTHCSSTCDSQAPARGHQMGTPRSLGKFGLINQWWHMVAEPPARGGGWGFAECGRLWWQRRDWKAVAPGGRWRGAGGEERRWTGADSVDGGWVVVLNPLQLGISYSAHRPSRSSKRGQEGKLGSNTTGKYIYELMSGALVGACCSRELILTIPSGPCGNINI